MVCSNKASHTRAEAVNKWDWLYGALALARQVASSVVPVSFIHFALADNVVKNWDRYRTLNRCIARTQLGAEPVPFFHNLAGGNPEATHSISIPARAGITEVMLSLFKRFAIVALFIAFLSSATKAQPPVTALAMAPDESAIVAGSQAGIEIAEWPTLAPRQQHDVGITQVHDLEFSPDGTRLLIVGGAASEYGEWKLLSWPQLKPIATRIAHGDIIHSATWLSGERFVTAAADNELIEWHVDDGSVELVGKIGGHSRRVLAVEAMPQQGSLVSAGVDQVLRVWNAQNEPIETPPRWNLDNHTGVVCDLAARPGAAGYLASASVDKTVRFWQPAIGRLVRFARLPVEPTSLAWSHDGERIAVGCADGKLRIVNPSTVEIEQTIAAIDGWIFDMVAASDGSFVVGGTAGAIVRVVP